MKTDEQIRQDVIDELTWEPTLKSSEIGVAVKDGIVTLSGQVDTYTKKIEAEKAVKRVKEVKGIAEDIIVKLPRSGKRTDMDIAESVIRSLKWNTSIPENSVKVKVEDGWVTLEGEVEWEFQKHRAGSIANNITGVKSVINIVAIRSHIKPHRVKEEIRKALERSADIEADSIEIEVENDTVTLSGEARTWYERGEIERAAWKTPGISNVKNYITL
jgi:osmotically-inducible protein OsmY